MGSGCGSVGRVVAFNSRGPRFDSSHRQNFIQHLFIINCMEKTKINKKRLGMAHFFKKNRCLRISCQCFQYELVRNQDNYTNFIRKKITWNCYFFVKARSDLRKTQLDWEWSNWPRFTRALIWPILMLFTRPVWALGQTVFCDRVGTEARPPLTPEVHGMNSVMSNFFKTFIFVWLQTNTYKAKLG